MKARRWIFGYVVCTELVYAAYEWALLGGPQNMNGLALGLVITALLLPSALVAPVVQFYLGQLLGYVAGDTGPLWPRLIGFQIAIVLQIVLLAFFFRNELRAKRNQHGA